MAALKRFAYKARDLTGAPLRGLIEAESSESARKLISEKNLIPIEIGPALFHDWSDKLKKVFENYTGRVPLEEMLVFNRQLQMSYSVGIPLIRGLSFIKEQTNHPKLKSAVGHIIERVSDGAPLATAMADHPLIFDKTTISLVRAGETGGQLDALLDRISVLAESRAENLAKIKSALFYPKIVITFLVVVFFVIVYFVIPKMTSFYGNFNAKLPGVTLFVMGLSDFFTRYWYLVFALLGGAIYGFLRWTNSPQGRQRWDRIKLKMPIFGPLLLNIEMNSFAIVLGLLLRSGITLLESLENVKASLTNTLIVEEIDRCQQEIKAGLSLAAGLSQSKIIPPMVINLLSLGEESGSLEEVLSRIASYYKLQIDYRLNNLSKAIEPALLFVIFGMVLVLALALFLPMWKMGSLIKR